MASHRKEQRRFVHDLVDCEQLLPWGDSRNSKLGVGFRGSRGEGCDVGRRAACIAIVGIGITHDSVELRLQVLAIRKRNAANPGIRRKFLNAARTGGLFGRPSTRREGVQLLFCNRREWVAGILGKKRLQLRSRRVEVTQGHGRSCCYVVYVGEPVVFESMYPIRCLHTFCVLMISVLSEGQCGESSRILGREIGGF